MQTDQIFKPDHSFQHNTEYANWASKLRQQTLPNYIVIEGPIGVGKTTLTKLLADTFNYEMLLEKADENPFIKSFYTDKKSAALATQLFFLFQRVEQIRAQKQTDMFQPIQVADFLLDKDQLFAEITLDENELQLYQQVHQHLNISSPTPDLVVYLQAPIDILLQRVEKRGISYEKAITSHYLQTLNETYAHFFHYYDRSPLLIVNASEIDWTNDFRDYQRLVETMLNTTQGRHYYNPQTTLPLER